VSLFKLKGGDGTVLWGPVSRTNCNGLAVDPIDYGVYVGSTSHCGGGAGVFKFDNTGAQAWNATGSLFCGGCGGYYIGNGGVVVDTMSSSPGVIFTQTGCYGTIGKVSRTDGSQQWCDSTNDVARPAIDPSNGQIYAMTSDQGVYQQLYTTTNTGSASSASGQCQGYIEINPADGSLYRAGSATGQHGCGANLYLMSKSSLGTVTWTKDLSATVSTIDGIAVQPWSGGYVILSSYTNSKIVVVDPASQAVVRTFSTAVQPSAIAVAPQGGAIYVSNGASNFVYAYSPTGTQLWKSPDLGGPVSNVAAVRGIVGSP
jgi:DNA-binding beta-propeller fold protein YncE